VSASEEGFPQLEVMLHLHTKSGATMFSHLHFCQMDLVEEVVSFD